MQMSLLGIGLPDVKMRLFLLKMSLLSLFFFGSLEYLFRVLSIFDVSAVFDVSDV